jgi:hypothetical protein
MDAGCHLLLGFSSAFLAACGSFVQMKHGLAVGDRVQGEYLPVADAQTEPAEFYKVSK